MSNITTIQPTQNNLPQAFQGQRAAQVFQGQQFESGAEGIEGSYPILKYAGKTWSLQYQGTNYPFIRSDDGTARGSIDVIVVRSANNKAKTYYKNFTPGSKDKPLCFSNDGVRPDPSVAQPPSKSCISCPMNVFGSRQTDEGKPAKACSDHKRLAVVLDPALSQSVLGRVLSEPALLRIPAASLNDFGNFSQSMEAQGFPLPSFVARIKFDPSKNFPKLVFEAVRPLDENEGRIALALRNDISTERIISEMQEVDAEAVDTPTVTEAGNAPTQPVGVMPLVEPAPVQQAQPAPQPVTAPVNPTPPPQVVTAAQPAAVQPTAVEAAPQQQTAQVVQMPVVPRPEAANPPAAPPPVDVDELNKSIDAKIGALLS